MEIGVYAKGFGDAFEGLNDADSKLEPTKLFDQASVSHIFSALECYVCTYVV